MTQLYGTDKEVRDRIVELRQAHAAMRVEICLRQALGLAYTNGRQWINVQMNPAGPVIDTWDEEWDPHKQEVRMTDNRIGPLYRNVAARTNATRIEAAVSTPRHVRSMQCSERAKISQDILNALEGDAMFTMAARKCSSWRWQMGSALLIVQAANKRNTIGKDILTNPDGSPIEINEQWLRWEVAPLSDLIWDPGNLSPELHSHQTLIYEQTLTARQFEQIYGPLESFKIKRDDLPKLGEIAPYYVAACGISGTSIFASYARMSEEKALRVVNVLEADPRDPGRWPEMYTVLDTSNSPTFGQTLDGPVINISNPMTPYGHHGRNIFKLDGFRRGDSVWAWGLSHLLMPQQDMLNIARSIQFQQLTAVTYGHWIVDQRSTDVEEFATSLSEGFGGVLKWNSHSDPQAKPPQYVSPPAPNQEFISISSELALVMRDQVHISAAQQGIGKTHIPEGTQQMLLQEASVVMDNIIIADSDEYSDALKVTLGTTRRAIERPGRMLARLRDQYGLTAPDLAEFLNLNPSVNELTVRVRESSVISRSVDERKNELNNAMTLKIITPMQYRVAMADELERPLFLSDEKQIDFIKKLLIKTIHGQPWIGISAIDYGMFEGAVREAIFGLDLDRPEDQMAMAHLEEALTIQRAISMENNGMTDGQGMPPGPPPDGQPQETSLLPDMRGGAPESINPVSNPVGAAGGLALGIA
jgi:hypothetical protein